MLPEGPTSLWLQRSNPPSDELKQWVDAIPSQNFDPPVPTTVDPLCYAIKIQNKFNSALTLYMIGTYYGPGEQTYNTALRYIAFKYQQLPTWPPNATSVVHCADDQHPVFDPTLTNVFNPDIHQYLGYWLASDPSTFVSMS